MKRAFLLLITLMVLVVSFSSCGKSSGNKEEQSEKSDFEQITEKGELVIGITYYEPMNYFNGDELVGFDTEYAKAVCEKLGVKPKFTLINWDTKETLLKSGEIDCIWNGLTVSDDIRENMSFTDSYLINKQCIVINKSDKSKFVDKASFDSAIITAESGSAGQIAIEKDDDLKKAMFSGSEDQQSALAAILTGNVDAAVVDITLAKAICGQGDFTELVILDIELMNEEYAIGFRLDSDMVEKVNNATKQLIEEGKLGGIAEKYGMRDHFDAISK